jgi:hypothetical protein
MTYRLKIALPTVAAALLLLPGLAGAQQWDTQVQPAPTKTKPAQAKPDGTAAKPAAASKPAVASPPQQAPKAKPAAQPPVKEAVRAPPAKAPPSAAAHQIADFFGKVGDQIYEDCIFELSEEQIEVQHALIIAYMEKGANDAQARKLAVKQIRPPKLSADCEKIRGLPRPGLAKAPVPKVSEDLPWAGVKKDSKTGPVAKPGGDPNVPGDMKAVTVNLAHKQVLPQWDCAPGVDFVSINRNGYTRKLTGGEICNPFEDVVRELPAGTSGFRFGYTIKTGRLYVLSSDPKLNGKTIAWAISGREVCRNNPDPECLAARAVGPLPPGEYVFASDAKSRVNFGPKSKRMVAGIYLTKLTHTERFTPAQTAAIKSRGNIAIHVRLKGEMSEACLGLEPKGWAYVSTLIKDGRAAGVTVVIDEPYPQLAETPPVVTASTFSLTSLFK